MKRTFLVSLAAAAVLLAQAWPAQAINKEWSAALGFLGGMMFANATCPGPMVVREPVVVEQPVVVHRRVFVEPPPPRGHYEYRARRVWVPGRWIVMSSGRCGYPRRVWEPGCYRHEQVRVWVQDEMYCGEPCEW